MSSESPNQLIAPVSQKERIVIIDSLRGFAILGILLMNIPGFGLPEPVAYGDLSVLNETGTNFKTWYFIDWFMEGTQRALFSTLFGAGVILFISRIEKRTEGTWPVDYFIRRQLWLLVFGLINAFVLLWFWDILFQYAICGIIIFTFRRLTPKSLIIAAVVSLLLQTARDNLDFYRDKKIISTGEMLAKIDTTQTKLTPMQSDQMAAYTELKEASTAEAKKKKMEKSLRYMQGSYAELYKYQSQRSFRGEVNYTYYGFGDILMFMFLGMALFKSGLLLGNAPAKTYWLLFIIGIGGGLILSWFRLQPMIDYNFNNYELIKNVKFEFYEISRGFRAVGLLGFIMLLYKSGWFKWLFALMRPVGQMAFTNYLTQSLFVGLYFYGIGFGMFGKLERYELYYVVAVTWTIQIIWSHIWLRYFRFGPLEWAWRCLTYWHLQPFRRNKNNTDTMGMG